MSTGTIVIVGGGPAGATTAALLAKAGRDVLLLERDTFPRDKLCGEFLSGDARAWLAKSGAEGIVADGATIRAARFSSNGRTAEIALPIAGIGLSRRSLDAALFEHAARCGAEVRAGVEVDAIERDADRFVVHAGEDRFEAALVIGAHGRRARIDKQLERPFAERRHPYVGLKRHHRASSFTLDGFVELHAFDGGYCGMSHVEGGVVNVCMLLAEPFVRAIGGAKWPTVVAAIRARSTTLDKRLATLDAVDEPCAVAQVPFVDKARHKDGVLFVGDAAGMIAPLTGDGQAMALESAVLLAELINEHGIQGAALGARWDRTWRRRFQGRMRLARGLQRLLLSPNTASPLVRLVGGVPGLGGALLRLTRTNP